MSRSSVCPALYQVNTRVWLTALGASLGRRATLDDIPDAELDRLAARGFDWIWLLSVWQTGEAGRRVSLNHPAWRREFAATLPDIRDEDIGVAVVRSGGPVDVSEGRQDTTRAGALISKRLAVWSASSA